MEKTSVIKYSLAERGRQYRGKDRNFDIPAIVRAINSPACQEKVKNRDMLGYYGHWVRLKYGLNPSEGGLEQGKPAFVEPALVTTLLRAYPDGTVEHQAQFLDNDSGNCALKLYQSHVGGFSSVIGNAYQGNPEFYGFDYVLEPNYTTNRGYTMDSLRECEGVTAEEIDLAIRAEQMRGMLKILDAVTTEREAARVTIDSLREENEELSRSLKEKEKALTDALAKIKATAPVVISPAATARMRRDMAVFDSAKIRMETSGSMDDVNLTKDVPILRRLFR